MIFEDPSRRWRLAVVVMILLVTSALGVLALAAMGVLQPVQIADVFQKRPSVRAKELADWKDSYVKPVYSAKQQKELQKRRAVERKRRAKLVGEAVDTVLPLPEPRHCRCVQGIYREMKPAQSLDGQDFPLFQIPGSLLDRVFT